MCFTGCRISDFKSLTKESVIERTLVYSAQKTKREKRTVIKVPLTPEAQRLIQDEPAGGKTLFTTISEQKFRDYIKEICIAQGIKKDVSLHTARHTFATLFIEETKDVVSLQKLLGHSRITDTMIYVHMSDESVRESMGKFNPLL
jgi:integrase